MENNPFASMIEEMRKDNKKQMPTMFRFGEVIAITPLLVDVAGTSQEEADFLKNDMVDSFELGDHLLLLPIEEEQRYIILCKVVNL